LNKIISISMLLPTLLLTLSACETSLSANTDWKRETVFFSNSDDLFYANDATRKTVDLFFGTPTDGPPTSGVASSFFDSKNTVINRVSGYQIGIKSRLESPLTPSLSWAVSGAASVGETTLLLPEGTGILVEPITIRFNSLQAESRIGLRQYLPMAERMVAVVSANIGIKAATSTTLIKSPVIAIHNTTSFADPFIGAEMEIEFSVSPENYTAESTLSFGVELRYYRTTGNTLSAGIGLKF